MKEEIEEQTDNDVKINEINIIIADDEMKTCEEIKKILSEYNQIKILGIANNDDDEIRMIEELKPDVVITDLMRNHQFTGLDIIKNYAEKKESPKFIVVSFTPDPGLCYRYKNISDCLYKYPKINGAELAYKIICAKRNILKEKQELLQKKLIEERNSSILKKLKRILFE